MTIFKAYDVRGVYGTEITEEIGRLVGQAFGSYINRGRVSLGRDTRLSGPSLQSAFLEGVLSTGCSVDSYGIIPISILSYVTWAKGRHAAAYISASHNPVQYNGVRFRTGEGYGMLYHETDIINLYMKGDFLTGQGRLEEYSASDALERYADHVGEKLDLKRRLKVVLDAGNGSACIMGPLYEKLGLDAILMNEVPDGNFPGRGPIPTKKSLGDACRAVIKSRADFGVGFDPDADRGLTIDDRGRVVPPEKIAIIIARRRYKPGDLVIAGFDCSMILESELESEGIKVQRERVGDVFIANRVKDSGAVLGVERSAHFFLPEFQYSDDPFAMSLALGEVISEGEKLSSLADQIPDYPYLQKSIRLDNDVRADPAAVMRNLEEKLAAMNPDTTDGLKISTETYCVLIRPSNTEPLLRLYIETTGCDPGDLAENYEKIIRQAMKQ